MPEPKIIDMTAHTKAAERLIGGVVGLIITALEVPAEEARQMLRDCVSNERFWGEMDEMRRAVEATAERIANKPGGPRRGQPS